MCRAQSRQIWCLPCPISLTACQSSPGPHLPLFKGKFHSCAAGAEAREVQLFLIATRPTGPSGAASVGHKGHMFSGSAAWLHPTSLLIRSESHLKGFGKTSPLLQVRTALLQAVSLDKLSKKKIKITCLIKQSKRLNLKNSSTAWPKH